jgi:hypothetical protein
VWHQSTVAGLAFDWNEIEPGCIGARVEWKLPIADCRLPIARKTLAEPVCSSWIGYLSQHTKTLYFGLERQLLQS